MSVLEILEIPDARLRTKAQPVTAFTPALEQTVANMFETMYTANGIGLAATQVNIHERIIVMDISKDANEPRVFINPEISKSEGETTYEEGCLSIPGIYEKVKRAEQIYVKAFDEKGVAFELEADELLAICIQHEIDHLNGIVFTDHLSGLKKNRALKKLEKLRREQAKKSKT